MKKVNFTWNGLCCRALTLVLAFMALAGGMQAQTTFQGSPSSLETGDNIIPTSPAIRTFPVTVTGSSGPLVNGANVSVAFTVAHTWVADLNIQLIAPDGQTLTLFNQNGLFDTNFGIGPNNMNTNFQDGAAPLPANGAPSTGAAVCPPTTLTYNGTFAPVGGTFAGAFSGANIDGQWLLRIQDLFFADGGFLCTNAQGGSFALTFSAAVPFCDPLEAPVITTCPADRSIFLDAGECFTTLDLLAETVATDCDPFTLAVTNTNPDITDNQFPVGTTTVTIRATDASGNVSAACQVDVTVNAFANPTLALACNDLVQISLDPDCVATIGADQILEGGPYGCYDNYLVQLLSPTGGLSPANLNFQNIGQTITVRVTDPTTGNYCWGAVHVEDKLAPVLVCPPDVTLPCAFDTDPGVAQVTTLEQTYATTDPLPAELPDNTTLEFTIPVNGPADATIVDLDFLENISAINGDLWFGNLRIELTSPQGTTVTIWENIGGCFGQPLFVRFDDEGNQELLCTAFDGGQNHNIPFGIGLLSDFDGENPNGDWIVTVEETDGFGDLLSVNDLQLFIQVNGTFGAGLPNGLSVDQINPVLNAPNFTPAFPIIRTGPNSFRVQRGLIDACSEVLLTFLDSDVTGTCANGTSGITTRTFKATDLSGNMATCTQIITLDRPTLDDVDIPLDILFTCEQYDAFPNIILPTDLSDFITDSDLTTGIIDVNLDPNCDDSDNTDNPLINSTNVDNGGGGCPGLGLDDADVLGGQTALNPDVPGTGSGFPTVGGFPLIDICGIGVDVDDITITVCPSTFKIVRTFTLIDWCADPVDVRQFTQVVKVADLVAPVIDLFAVTGETLNNYGTSDIPALGDGGGCNLEPQFSGGTKFVANVQIPTGLTPANYQNLRLSSISLDINHARVGDLDIFLKSPSGNVLELTSNNGGNGTKIRASFSDIATSAVTGAGNNIIGTFTPEGTAATSCGGFGGNIETIEDFGAITSSGTGGGVNDVLGQWQLIVFDETAPATGKVVSWKLFFTYDALVIDVYNASVPNNAAPHTSCAGSVVIPPVDGFDNCSSITGYVTELYTIVPGTGTNANNPALPMTLIGALNSNGGIFPNVPLFQNGAQARYLVIYRAQDACGNQSSTQGVITLRDKVPPVPICREITEISITNNGLSTGTSCSTLHAEDLDEASYDNCKPVYFLMADMADAPGSPAGSIYGRCYRPSLDFCCEDIGNRTIILLVLDADPTTFANNLRCTGEFGTLNLSTANALNLSNAGINFNTCMVTVQVTDKINPILVSCPQDQRVTCDWFANNLQTQLQPSSTLTAAQKCQVLTDAGFGTAVFFDNCATNITCNFNYNIDQCIEGTLTRTFTVTDGATPPNAGIQTCTQRIFVDHVSDFAVTFPDDVELECTDDFDADEEFGAPVIFYETCELVAISHEDQLFTTVPDVCYKIIRTWTVINWCVVGDDVDQEVVEQPESQLGLPFPQCDVNSDGTCSGGGNVPIGARTFRDSWRSGLPANLNRPSAVDANRQFTPDTDPDDDPWDGYITYQQTLKVIDNEPPVFVNCPVPDGCIDGTDPNNLCAKVIEFEVPEVTECTEFSIVTIQVRYRLQGSLVWTNGGTVILGDATLNGTPITNNDEFPNTPALVPGTYQLEYVAIDNCNNQSSCNTTFMVMDCKKPTPYCKNGLVVELMQTGMVALWASDFDAGSFDNCPGTVKLSFSANVADTGRVYTCDDLGDQTVNLWVTDAKGNQDFCITFVNIQANMNQCPGDDPIVAVAGQTATESNVGVPNVNVSVNAASGSFNQTAQTNTSGNYNLANVPAGGDYTLTPSYDVNPLNGVSTFDLVLISKHILQIEALSSPYKIIAADANKSNSVTTFDLVAIRKLILFIDTEFANNTSWRFVDKSFSFPNPANPFQSQFPEVINLNNVSVDMLNQNFVAVKVGDVNGSADVNLLGENEDRTMVGDLVLNADDAILEAGQTYTVNFKATDFNVSGYQFTLNFDKSALEFAGVEAGLADASNFGTTMVNEGVLTTSWNSDEAKNLTRGDVVFGLTFKATKAGRLSDMLSINSRYTVAEAYSPAAELYNVALSFNNATAATGFDLYQNTPNPFVSTTTIGFYLPEATSATLTISDVQGKVVKVITRDAVKGYNQVDLKRSELGATGVLYYRLDTDSDSATRKMILVD